MHAYACLLNGTLWTALPATSVIVSCELFFLVWLPVVRVISY
jgi:hypothetical protein